MDEFANWLEGNGEAIYNTQPWKIYGEGGVTLGGHFKERGIASVPWDETVCRFTCNNNNDILYIHIFGNPAGKELAIKSLSASKGLFASKISGVSVIGVSSDIKWAMTEDGLSIIMPDKLHFTDCNILKIATTGL
jgi:alpha-L-fucosidase